MTREFGSGTFDDYRYTSVRDHALAMVRALIERLDAVVCLTEPRRPPLISAPIELQDVQRPATSRTGTLVSILL
jgi:hypothetical protein